MRYGLSVVVLLTKVTGSAPGTGLNVIVGLPVTVTLPALALTTAAPGVGSSVTVIVDRSPCGSVTTGMQARDGDEARPPPFKDSTPRPIVLPF